MGCSFKTTCIRRHKEAAQTVLDIWPQCSTAVNPLTTAAPSDAASDESCHFRSSHCRTRKGFTRRPRTSAEWSSAQKRLQPRPRQRQHTVSIRHLACLDRLREITTCLLLAIHCRVYLLLPQSRTGGKANVYCPGRHNDSLPRRCSCYGKASRP